jgi:hypothetical protein
MQLPLGHKGLSNQIDKIVFCVMSMCSIVFSLMRLILKETKLLLRQA